MYFTNWEKENNRSVCERLWSNEVILTQKIWNAFGVSDSAIGDGIFSEIIGIVLERQYAVTKVYKTELKFIFRAKLIKRKLFDKFTAPISRHGS